jgi:hypothetical protein
MSTTTQTSFSTPEWGTVDLSRMPHLPIPPPGPMSKHYHARTPNAMSASFASTGIKAREEGLALISASFASSDFISLLTAD